MSTHSSTAHEPALADAPAPLRSKALSYVRELGVKPEHTKAVVIGASVAAALAIVVVVVRARRRVHEPRDEGSGVFGTIVKGALFAALQTVVKVKAAQLASKALRHDTDRTPVEAATNE